MEKNSPASIPLYKRTYVIPQPVSPRLPLKPPWLALRPPLPALSPLRLALRMVLRPLRLSLKLRGMDLRPLSG